MIFSTLALFSSAAAAPTSDGTIARVHSYSNFKASVTSVCSKTSQIDTYMWSERLVSGEAIADDRSGPFTLKWSASEEGVDFSIESKGFSAKPQDYWFPHLQMSGSKGLVTMFGSLGKRTQQLASVEIQSSIILQQTNFPACTRETFGSTRTFDIKADSLFIKILE
jgi:hypothetical protein